jgi:hypothetical protein
LTLPVALEQNLRKLIRNQLKATYGKKNALAKLLATIPSDRRPALSHLDIDEILKPDDSPLYLLDLVNVFKKEWAVFVNIFDIEKNKFVFMLEEVNTLRKDAHSNSIGDDDFTQLRLYHKKLDELLDAWI